jgi:hypothetical protein
MEILETYVRKDKTRVIKIRKSFLFWSWEFYLHQKNGTIVKYKNGKTTVIGLEEWCDARILFDHYFEDEFMSLLLKKAETPHVIENES